MKRILGKLFTTLFFAAILFFGLKGCVTTIWTSPTEHETYAVRGADGRSLTMIFAPKGLTYFVYMSKAEGHLEETLTRMRGTHGTHYFWRLWSVDSPSAGEGLFGYRLYPDGSEPVVMETTVLNKFVQGNGDQTLPAIGERTHPVILFADGRVRFASMWLRRETTDPALVADLEARLSAGASR